DCAPAPAADLRREYGWRHDTLPLLTTPPSAVLFFFSSRRRHTRSKRDWSSDVCSSDLATEAHTSALKYGVAFVAVMMDDSPQPVIRNLSPTNSTVIWDRNRRRAAAGVTVTRGTTQSVEQFILSLPDQIVTGTYLDARWRLERVPHRLGRCPIAVLPYRPSSESPLGRSRVTQAVMSITDRAVRSLLRMEVSAEFYSSPQRAILGADESMFMDADGNPVPKWTATISRYLAAP